MTPMSGRHPDVGDDDVGLMDVGVRQQTRRIGDGGVDFDSSA
jgi:hypothetical protein